jgi:hypothetical protein
MTKQEAIQEQIDEIMDSFNFERVQKIMETLNWEWHEQGVPDIYSLRTEARKHLKQAAATVGTSGSGGFTAIYMDGKDDKPWLRLELHFGIDSMNDGTEYE